MAWVASDLDPNRNVARGDGRSPIEGLPAEPDGTPQGSGANQQKDVSRGDGDPLLQKDVERKALGAFSVDPETHQGIIQLFQGANKATLPHEIGHFIRHKWLEGSDLQRVEAALGVKDGKWTRAAEERFAEIHEEIV